MGYGTNAKGEPAHSKPDGSDWSISQWFKAAMGELGEAANVSKKVDRGDLSMDEARSMIADELADVVVYLDILAYQCGVDLGRATTEKWNRTSAKVGCDIRIEADDWHLTGGK